MTVLSLPRLRRPGRAAVTALVLGGVIAALSACDRDFTATVSADQTVSGQVTYSTTQESWDADPGGQANAKQYVEGRYAAAFPMGTITSGQKDGRVYDTVTFTKISFDEFESGVDTLMGAGTPEGEAPTPPSLTFANGVYTFNAPRVSGSLAPISIYGDTVLNSLSLTFPDAIKESNGSVKGSTVVWDFVAHPDLASLHAVTRAAVVTVPTVTPAVTPTVSVAAGKVVTKGAARVGHRVRVRAPRALTAGTTVRYAWVVGHKVVATTSKPSYKPTRKQAGKRLTVRVQYLKSGYRTVVRTATFGRIKR